MTVSCGVFCCNLISNGGAGLYKRGYFSGHINQERSVLSFSLNLFNYLMLMM